MPELVDYTENNYREFEHYAGIAVIRFHAPWCAPCVQNKAIFVQLAAQCDESIMFGQVNIDLAPILTLRYQVFGLPSTLIFQDGVIIDRVAGVKSLTFWIQRIQQLQSEQQQQALKL